MNLDQFENIVNTMEGEESNVRATKGKEYSDADRLSMFKKFGQDIKCPHCKEAIGPMVVFWIFFNKHISSILSYINSGKTYSEDIRSRIMDCRVYLSLFNNKVKRQRLSRKASHNRTHETKT